MHFYTFSRPVQAAREGEGLKAKGDDRQKIKGKRLRAKGFA